MSYIKRITFERVGKIVENRENPGYRRAESKESTRPLVLTRKQGKWIIRLCLTVGQVQNGRRTSKNSEILWTLKSTVILLIVYPDF